ncbi:MAG: glycyl-radical enzyme activating protein [Bacillota bacterium]
MTPRAIIRDIQRYSIHDGPGIRTTVFFKGCPLKCAWCANPDTQQSGIEIAVAPELCIHGCSRCLGVCASSALAKSEEGRISVHWPTCNRCADCAGVCPSGAILHIGREVTVDEVVSLVRRDKPFYDCSGGGVTLSGGEPLAQPSFLLALLEALRAERIHAVLDTCGLAAPELFEKVLADLVFFDLKIVDPDQHFKWTGSRNDLILDNFRRLVAMGVPLQVRFPLVPGITDTERNLEQIAMLVNQASLLKSIDVLPYHRMGVRKYSLLGKHYMLEGFGVRPPTNDQVTKVVEYFSRHGIKAEVVV